MSRLPLPDGWIVVDGDPARRTCITVIVLNDADDLQIFDAIYEHGEDLWYADQEAKITIDLATLGRIMATVNKRAPAPT